MEASEALVMLAVVGVAAAVVLRDIAAYERPAREKQPREKQPREKRPREKQPREKRPREKRPAKQPRRERDGATAVAAYVPVEDGSMLGALALTEQDERSALRRVVSALVLLTLTLLTAALIGAGIYRGLSGFGK